MPADLSATVYAELRELAAAKMARERDGHTLDATGLVHEALVRLGGDGFATRSAFVRAASVAMSRILVDHARGKQADKRGGGRRRAALDLDHLAAPASDTDPEAVAEALARLAAEDPPAAELVTLRFFGGLTLPEAADALGMAPRTADRLWAFARAWLYRDLSAD